MSYRRLRGASDANKSRQPIVTISEDLATTVSDHLWPKVEVGHAPLAELTTAADFDLQQSPGTSLTVAKHRIARKIWKADFTKPFEPWRPLSLL